MRELRRQLVGALLMILTVASVINFQQQSKYHLPDDGVTWVDRNIFDEKQPVAAYIAPGSPAERAGIHQDDLLVSIEGNRVDRAQDATRILGQLGAWRKAEYRVIHKGI